MSGYKSFVQNNCNEISQNDHKKTNDLPGENKIKEKNDEIVESVNKVNKTKQNKIKNITVEDLSNLSDEESFVEALRIVVEPSKKKVHFANDVTKSETNEIEKIISNTSKLSDKKKINNNEIIRTVAGIWFVSSDNLNNVNSKTKKVHKDVENAFKTVETELKNKINEKLLNINKVEVRKPCNEGTVKQKNKRTDSDYLKINKKRSKTKLNEPLNEDSKALDISSSINSAEKTQNLGSKSIVKSTKQVQNIDPSEFLQVSQTNLETEEMALVEDHLDDNEENDQEKLIAEAFADDDIINEFK